MLLSYYTTFITLLFVSDKDLIRNYWVVYPFWTIKEKRRFGFRVCFLFPFSYL